MCIAVIEAAREAKRLKAWIAVLDNIAKFIVVEALGNGAIGCIDNEPWATEVVGDDSVSSRAFDEVIRYVDAGAVDETAHDVASAIQFNNGFQLVLIEETLG